MVTIISSDYKWSFEGIVSLVSGRFGIGFKDKRDPVG
jgi:hypothetical protein